MDNLLNHWGFRLIYVDDNGNMSLITPQDHKEDILENGYRCISHLWGEAIEWNNHPVKDVLWKVEVRKEKREKLLQIFNHYKGYWWMDVFCTDQESSNKPLSIMGDVYKCCKECICLLDIKISKIFKEDGEILDDYVPILKHAFSVSKCKWSKRVWTLQEWLLPKEICYTEETLEKHFYMINPRDIEYRINYLSFDNPWFYFYMFSKPRRMASTYPMFDSTGNIQDIIEHIAKSGRKCAKPEDYYYGIAGIIGIPLTDGLLFREVEKEFLLGLKKIENADTFIIKESRNEKHIYKQWKHKQDPEDNLAKKFYFWIYNTLV